MGLECQCGLEEMEEFQIPDGRFQIPDGRFQIPDGRFQIGFQILDSNFGNMFYYIWNLESGI
jgi:hypothetical protein